MMRLRRLLIFVVDLVMSKQTTMMKRFLMPPRMKCSRKKAWPMMKIGTHHQAIMLLRRGKGAGRAAGGEIKNAIAPHMSLLLQNIG